jgi:thymidylate kinase
VAGYHELARSEPDRFRIIDASGSVDDVAARVIECVSASLDAHKGGSP